MAEIQKYVLVDSDDVEQDWEYDTLREAENAAQDRGNLAIIARTYEYSDSELVWTPDGSDTWPPDAVPANA